MKIFPEDRKKRITYSVVLIIAALVLIYLLFLRGGGSEPESILTSPADQAGSGAVIPTQSLQSRLLPHGSKLDEGVLEDERFQILRPVPDLNVSTAELGNSNPFSLSP